MNLGNKPLDPESYDPKKEDAKIDALFSIYLFNEIVLIMNTLTKPTEVDPKDFLIEVLSARSMQRAKLLLPSVFQKIAEIAGKSQIILAQEGDEKRFAEHFEKYIRKEEK